MSWTKLPGVGQSGILNIDGLVRYNGHWYMLSTDYRLNEFGGGSFDHMFSEVRDIQSMSRVHRGGPWRQIRYPDSSQWIDGNARGGTLLIVYKDKIYFSTRDYSVLPSTYYTRVWRFDPRAGIGTLQNVFTSALLSDACFDAWPNDMCIHNDKLFIACCDQVIRFDGTSWTALDPFPLSFEERDSNGAWNDFVSVCSFNGKLYLSAATYGQGYPDTYYDRFRIMVSDNDGLSWDDVTVWNEDQFSDTYGDQWMACLTPFNGSLYMVTDIEAINRSKIYKMDGGLGSPALVLEDSSYRYRMYGSLFTTRYDDDTTLYIGSYNSIKSMDASENITTELSIKPYRPTYFINGFCDDEVTGQFAYVGGNNGWVSSVNPVNAQAIYYSVAYSKDFSGYPYNPELPEPPVVVIPLPTWTDPGEPPIDPNDPPIDIEGTTNAQLIATLKNITVITTTVSGGDVSITITPGTIGLTLTRYYISNVSSSVTEIDPLSLVANELRAHCYVADSFTHDVPLLNTALDFYPITISTQTLAGGSHCKAIWNFESGALYIDSKGHNDLTDYYYVSESTVANGYKRGTCAASFDADLRQSFQITDSELDEGFPLKSGDSKKTTSVCFWMKPTSVNVSSAKRIYNKYNYANAQCSLGITQYLTKIRIYWGTGPSAATYTTTAPTMVAGQWYHVGVVVDGINRSLAVRIWDDTAQAAYDYSTTPANPLYVGPAAVAIGAMPDAPDNSSYCFSGVLDELIVFDSLLTSDDIDAIRANGISTFGDTQTSVTIEQDLLTVACTQLDLDVIIGDPYPYITVLVGRLSLTCTQFDVTIDSNYMFMIVPVDLQNIASTLHEVTATADYEVTADAELLNLVLTPNEASIRTFNIFTEDADCVALWKLEEGALTADSIGTNTLTAGNNPATSTADFREGHACASLAGDPFSVGNGPYLRITNANLDAGFPLKNGDTTKQISMCCWFKTDVAGSSLQGLLGFVSIASNNYDCGLCLSWSTYTRLCVRYISESIFPTDMRIYADEWYHVGLVVDAVAKSVYVRYYRLSTDTAIEYSSVRSTEMVPNGASFMIGGFTDNPGLATWDGLIDEVVVFDRLLTADEIDKIRNATFGNPTVNDFSNNPNCIGLWNFESDVSASLGTISLSNSNGVTISSEDPKLGSASAQFASSSNQNLYVEDANLPEDFPLKSTNEDQLFSMCAWVRVDETSRKAIVSKSNSAGGGLALIASSDNVLIQWGNQLIDSGVPTVVGDWGHYAVVADVKNNRLGVVVYSITTGMTDFRKLKPSASITLPSTTLRVGNHSDAPSETALEGMIDELVMFKELLSITSIDKIRKGEYTFPTGETNTSSTLAMIGDPTIEVTPLDVTVLTPLDISVDIPITHLTLTARSVRFSSGSVNLSGRGLRLSTGMGL